MAGGEGGICTCWRGLAQGVWFFKLQEAFGDYLCFNSYSQSWNLFSFSTLHGMQDLSFTTRDQTTQGPCLGGIES